MGAYLYIGPARKEPNKYMGLEKARACPCLPGKNQKLDISSIPDILLALPFARCLYEFVSFFPLSVTVITPRLGIVMNPCR